MRRSEFSQPLCGNEGGNDLASSAVSPKKFRRIRLRNTRMERLPRRLLRHHLPLGLATCAIGLVLYRTRPSPDIIERLSFASAYPALILISATLMIGPSNLIGRKRLPVSIDLRRDLGIWAGMTGVFHAGVGQCVHLRGRPWLYYVYEDWRKEHFVPVRYDMFGLAHNSGFLA